MPRQLPDCDRGEIDERTVKNDVMAAWLRFSGRLDARYFLDADGDIPVFIFVAGAIYRHTVFSEI